MPLLILTGILSLALHLGGAWGAFFYGPSGGAALHHGAGNDMMVVEQGIALEGFAQLGQDEFTLEEIEAIPAEASEAQPEIKEVSEVEEYEVLSSAEGPVQEDFEEPVEEVLEQPLPPQLAALAQEAEIAVREHRAAGEAREGGDATAQSAYMGVLRGHIEKHKVNPRSRYTGTAVVRFKVDSTGNVVSREVTSSSGNKVLDEAAVASIDQAAPFPPMPNEVGRSELEISVPFQFKIR